MSHLRKIRAGFTLIELLVVIAIIAVLLGILLPTLGKARLTAQTVKSKANLRSMGQIQFLYAGEYKDSYINPFNTNKTPQSNDGVPGGWASATKPGLDDYWWEFSGPGPWYSEMYAFHWYSLIASWVNEGDYASEVQFAPADKIIISRFADLPIDQPGFTLSRGIWDSSYVLSPTVWFSPKRYAENGHPTTQRRYGARSQAKRNKVSDTTYPSNKVIIWERFDWSQKTRRPTVPNPFDPTEPEIAFPDEIGHPQWNNSGAQPNTLTADGSVYTAKISEIRELSSDSNLRTARAFTPTFVWNIPETLLRNYGMEADGFEIGRPIAGFGQGLYPAYFWATRDGIKGRDVVR